MVTGCLVPEGSIDTLEQKKLWDLIEKAVAAGFTLRKPVTEYRQMYSRGKGSLYHRLLKDLRSTKGFHVDPDHFKEWLDSVTAPELTLWQRDGDTEFDWAFTLSLQIQSFYGAKFDDDFKTATALGGAVHLTVLVEALCAGLVDAGYNWRTGWRPTRFVVARIEYAFHDSRHRDPETEVVRVGDDGRLIGWHSFRTRFSALFGVLSDRKGVGVALNPERDVLMLFSCPKGSARVVELEPAPQPQMELPAEDQLFIRLRDAGNWGEQQTVAALKLAEKVKAGQAAFSDADEVLRHSDHSLSYWRQLQELAVALAKTRRNRRD